MTDIKFLNTLRNYLFITLVLSIFGSLLLTGKVHGFHFLAGIFIPISFLISKNFYFSNINTAHRLFQIKLFWFSLTINILFVFIIGGILIHINEIPFIDRNDGFTYNMQSTYLADTWRRNGFSLSNLYTGIYSGFPNFSAILMYYTGIHEWWIPRIGNAFLASFSMLFVFNMLNNVYHQLKTSKLLISFLTFSPLIIVFESLQLKDTLHYFLLLGAFNYYIKSISFKFRLINIFLIVMFLAALLFVRPGTIFAFIATILVYQLLINQRRGITKLSNLLTNGIIIVLLFLSWSYLAKKESIKSYDFYYEARVGSRTDGSSVIGSRAAINKTTIGNFASIPLYIIVSPFFPTPVIVNLSNLTRFSTNHAFIPSIYMLGFIPFLISSLLSYKKWRTKFNIASVFLIFYVIYRVGQSLSMSVFSMRQSLPAEIFIFLLLPTIFLDKDKPTARSLSFFITIIVMFAFSIIRLRIRGRL